MHVGSFTYKMQAVDGGRRLFCRWTYHGKTLVTSLDRTSRSTCLIACHRSRPPMHAAAPRFSLFSSFFSTCTRALVEATRGRNPSGVMIDRSRPYDSVKNPARHTDHHDDRHKITSIRLPYILQCFWTFRYNYVLSLNLMNLLSSHLIFAR